VPYLDVKNASGYFLLIPPLLSVLLVWIAFFRIEKEFDLLDEVKTEYLGERRSSFRCHTLMYIGVLGTGATVHFTLLLLSCIWHVFGKTIGVDCDA
jgi:hypothetical protein